MHASIAAERSNRSIFLIDRTSLHWQGIPPAALRSATKIASIFPRRAYKLPQPMYIYHLCDTGHLRASPCDMPAVNAPQTACCAGRDTARLQYGFALRLRAPSWGAVHLTRAQVCRGAGIHEAAREGLQKALAWIDTLVDHGFHSGTET